MTRWLETKWSLYGFTDMAGDIKPPPFIHKLASRWALDSVRHRVAEIQRRLLADTCSPADDSCALAAANSVRTRMGAGVAGASLCRFAPAHEAVVARLLAQEGVDVNQGRTSDGTTALMAAAACTNPAKPVLQLLLDTGHADLEARELDGLGLVPRRRVLALARLGVEQQALGLGAVRARVLAHLERRLARVRQAHERDVDMDLVLVTLRRMVIDGRTSSKRVPKVIIMSATVDAQRLCGFFGDRTPHLHVGTRPYPVRVHDLEEVIQKSRSTEFRIEPWSEYVPKDTQNARFEREASRACVSALHSS